MHQRLWVFLGFVMTALGMIGLILPGMPTTVFLLVAVWAFSKGNPALATYLESHRVFGPPIAEWKRHRAIPLKAKVSAITMIGISLTMLLIWSDLSFYTLLLIGSFMGGVAGWILWCPTSCPTERTSDYQGPIDN